MHERVLIWAEQGVGDEILFSGMFPEIAQVLPHCLIEIDRRLLPLYQRSMPKVTFVPRNEPINEDQFDSHYPAGSLGQHFRRSLADFKPERPSYLVADQTRAQQIRASLCPNGERLVGLSWHSKNLKFGQAKSLTLEQLLPVLQIPGVRFVNLQYGAVADEIASLRANHGIEIAQCDSVDNFSDLDGLAALIEACDLVLTISNTTTHLAGALGKKTLLLLSFGNGLLWYWSNEQAGHSLWYPSVQIVKQTQVANWQEPINAAVQIVQGLAER